MEEAIVRARKLGGSLVLTIPNDIVKEEGIKEGEAVKVKGVIWFCNTTANIAGD